MKITDRLAATPAFNPETADQALDVALARAGLKDGAARQAFRDGPAAGTVKRAIGRHRKLTP